MLKIKDNIDLKELEKFGFENNKISYYKKRNNHCFDFMKVNIKIDTLEVTFYNTNDDKINKLSNKNHKWLIDIMNQLKQSDLIEKVVEE